MNNTPETDHLAATSVAGVPLPGVDGRTRRAKRFRQLVADISAALGRPPSPTDRTLILDAAALALESESLAAQAAAGARIDPDVRVRVSGALGRALERLGLTTGATTAEPKPDPATLFARVRDPNYWKAQR